MATITIPGNLLLLGEYAVLEEGGLGIALAVERRITIRTEGAPFLAIHGSNGPERFEWPAEKKGSLLDCVVTACAAQTGSTLREMGAVSLHIDVDTSAFFDASRRKSGFGSSAAVAAGVSFAILRECGVGADGLVTASFRAALAGHRAYQAGRGSGYDVGVSLSGGVVLFTGGSLPSLSPVALAWLPRLALFPGARPVRTADAVGRFEKWKSGHPKSAAEFLAESNRCVKGFASSASWDEAATWFEASRDLAIWVGVQIGVPAEISPPSHLQSHSFKAVGAGNELGLVCLPGQRGVKRGDVRDPTTEAPKHYRVIEIASTGLNWIESEDQGEAG